MGIERTVEQLRNEYKAKVMELYDAQTPVGNSTSWEGGILLETNRDEYQPVTPENREKLESMFENRDWNNNVQDNALGYLSHVC